ncbi:nuclear transport factor 2 family protein [Roseomonas eburnea]|uniref:Nuclear transport factor 2 family protein n=1 Tax=Neoroseomonas eburnea TaxID=1346889 RepID=A0A9X9X856_9PROT|nr:nuclear transport factor 2 family protein [Neoroseomonas eburnea]MBR0679892.1 nuclear transport factor 2 family protein [Neoroseomonas eburnea]
MSTDRDAILATVHGYFDALYEGSVARFREVFHPQAQLFSAEGGVTEALGFEAYMARVAGRPAPASRGDTRHDEVVSLTQPSPTTAHVRVRDALLPNRFVDELLLVRYPQGWRIVSKAWAYDPAARTA